MASNNAGDESDRGGQPKEPSDDQAQHPKPSALGRLIVDICNAFIEKRQKDSREESRENKRFYFELMTVVGVTVYTILTFWLVITQRETMVSASRAWLTPVSAGIVGDLTVGEPLNYEISYGNVGKEPALGFVAQEDDPGTVDEPAPHTSWYTVFDKSKITDVCRRTAASDEAETIYPSGLETFVYHVSTAKLPITQQIIDGSKVIFVHGCFAYKTFGHEHKSEYCFLLHQYRDLKTREIVYKGISCPYGNKAN